LPAPKRSMTARFSRRAGTLWARWTSAGHAWELATAAAWARSPFGRAPAPDASSRACGSRTRAIALVPKGNGLSPGKPGAPASRAV